ncbi:MAG: hypothetical protein ACI9MC_002760 [Kiritimatiellia bacterium]
MIRWRGVVAPVAGCLTALLLVGCRSSVDECANYAPGDRLATVSDQNVVETSGLAASLSHDDVLWAHNDKGDHARIFALGLDGVTQSTVTLRDVQAVDFEDIAVGPGPDGENYVYVADTGDNDGRRSSSSVYRFEEPELEPSVVVGVDVLEVVFPDGPVDVEAIMVDPRSGDVLLVSKGVADMSTIYDVGTSTTVQATLDLGVFPGRGQVTGADISADGSTIAVRTPTHVFLWSRGVDESVIDAILGEACSLPIEAEAHGEAVAIAADGSGLYTLGEGLEQPLWFYRYDVRL